MNRFGTNYIWNSKKCPNAAQMWPKCGPNAARMWPEDEILQPEMNPWKFSVARARPEPKPQARNPTRTMKKVARPSPTHAAHPFIQQRVTHANYYQLKK